LSYRRPKKSVFHHNGGHVSVAETHPPSSLQKLAVLSRIVNYTESLDDYPRFETRSPRLEAV